MLNLYAQSTKSYLVIYYIYITMDIVINLHYTYLHFLDIISARSSTNDTNQFFVGILS